MEQAGLKIIDCIDDPIIDLDKKTKTLTITAHRLPYIPAAIFKCLVKMAIAIAPTVLLSELGHLTKWIRETEHRYETFPYKPLVAFQQFTPGPMPYPGVSLFLLKRKPEVTDVPYLQFIIAFGNTMFQIVVPMPKQDKQIMGIPIKLSFFPIPFTEDYEYGETSMKELDLSRYEVIKNDPHLMHMRFKHVEQQEII